MDDTQPGAAAQPPEKQALQALAHGGEGQPHAYGSGVAPSPPEPSARGARRSKGDGASPVASAAATRKQPGRKPGGT